MNQQDSGRFRTESLESAAKRYNTLGFSIIPLHGARNPQQPKLPAIKWARFQHTIPSDEELQNWFHNHNDAGIGIVCGRISRLIVLDFDSAEGVSEFRHLLPDLLETFTVRSGTRGLPHFYYRLPEGKLVTTTAYPGVDLRGEGAYVVAPPTCVGNAEWVVENDLPIHAISEFELRRVMRFLAGLKPKTVEPLPDSLLGAQTGVSEFRHLSSADELIAYYRQFCGLGRNHALFKTAVVARDAGIRETACCFMLAVVHAREPGKENEDYQSRYAEAIRTIASAYKRPARQQMQSRQIRLGNTAREWLLGHQLAALSRVLDGLYLIGMKPHESFTELDAVQKLGHLKIGRRSIMAALKAEVNDKPLFEAVCTPLYPPTDANAANRSDDLNNSCKMSRGAKRVINGKRGRPAQFYRLPSPDEVADKIGVKASAGDVVIEADFISPKTYRQTLHKQLLERRPGHYARTWLAERLGVSRWTTQRYEKSANIHVTPSYSTQKLSWALAATLPQERQELAFGTFLESNSGKRYPAIKGLALKLLKDGCEPILKQQQANYYEASLTSVGIPTPQFEPEVINVNAYNYGLAKNRLKSHSQGVGIPTPPAKEAARYARSNPTELLPSVGIPTRQQVTHQNQIPITASGVGIPTPPIREAIFWLCPECLDFHVAILKPDSCSRCGCCEWEVVPQTIWQNAQALKHWWQNRYREHQNLKRKSVLMVVDNTEEKLTTAAKTLVEKIHAQIPNLSFANARKVVSEFSENLIEKALLAIRSHTQLKSPAGFLIAFLRSENKLLNNNKIIRKPKPKAKGESSSEWVLRLMKSKYLSFLSNADDIMKLSSGLTSDLSPA